MFRRRVARGGVVGVVVFTVVALAASAAGAWDDAVLPSDARPHGYSLERMARTAAQFNSSGNDLKYYPDTPFQLLYADFSNTTQTQDGCGIDFAGGNTFTVRHGTPFYVPVDNWDDSPPVAGTFPTTHNAAEHYFWDQAQLGGRDFRVVVDGDATRLGRDYLAGPVTTPPLPDGGGTHIISLAAFVQALSKGTHTVSISGGVFGDLIQTTFGVCFAKFAYTYTVTVN